MSSRHQLWGRGIRSLAHPVSIAAILLLLVNDHWLRWYYPSWWTGKIGDFVWLLFAPFLVILALSYVLPQKTLRYIDIISFTSTGLIFILGNTIADFHEIIVKTFHLLMGWKPLMYRDPTDLLMLPGLVIGWKIWQESGTFESLKLNPLHKRTIGLVMLSLGALGTMANGPSYDDYGVYCVVQQNNLLQAITGNDYPDTAMWYTYQSKDGGLTWEKTEMPTPKAERPCEKETASWEIADPSNENIHFRVEETGVSIDQSRDAGKTWTTLYEFPAGKQVRKYYYRPHPQNFGPRSRIINPGGPYNGVVDKATGNLVVSMGFEGVVVISPKGDVTRVAVGPYVFVDIHNLSLQERLANELILAGVLACLVIAVLSIPLWPTNWWKAMIISGVMFWILVSLLFKESGLVDIAYTLFLHFSVWIIYPILAIIASIKIIQKHSWQLVAVILATTIVSVILFIMPLLFWATGKIPSYQLVMALSVVTMSLPILYSYRHIYYQYVAI